MFDNINIVTVKSFLAAQYANEFERAFQEYATPDFEWVVSTRDNAELTAAIPWAGRSFRGRDGYQELTGELFGEYEPLKFEPVEFFDTGTAVFVVGRFSFRHRRTLKMAESDWVAMFRMRGGRITGGQFFENTYAIAAGRN